MKNLVYVGIFFNVQYIELLKLLLISIKLFSRTDTFDFLVLTTKEFEQPIQQLSAAFDIPIKMKFFPYTTKNEAANARLHIFEYENIDDYGKILYLDADVLVQQDLTRFFTNNLEDKLYACEEEYTLTFASHGAPFFDFSKIDPATRGFNSGTLLFQNTSTMKRMFQDMTEHISYMEKNNLPMPFWGDQPFLNFHAFKSNLFSAKYMNEAVFLTVQPLISQKTNIIRQPVSPHNNTDVILHHFLNRDKFDAVKAHMNYLLRYYTSRKASNDSTLQSLLHKRHSWGAGYILFEDGNTLKTTWGNGKYKLLDTHILEAAWNGISHILLFDTSFSRYTSIRLGDFEIVRGVQIDA
jgi:lipopolysaccharide biosynthesis glycosyltransferase